MSSPSSSLSHQAASSWQRKARVHAVPLVLIVEDSPDDEALIVRAMRKTELAMEQVIVHDGGEALRYLAHCGAEPDRARPPDVVFTDLNLPAIDGLALLRAMRSEARTATIPVVVFSASLHADDLHQAYELGANSFIRKPVDAAAFTEVVQRLARYWLTLNIASPGSAAGTQLR